MSLVSDCSRYFVIIQYAASTSATPTSSENTPNCSDVAAPEVSAVVSLILAPLGIIETTANTSGTATSEQFGVFSILVGVGLVLATYWMITQYLEQSETSDTLPIPGLGDAPGFLPLGVTEENEDEN